MQEELMERNSADQDQLQKQFTREQFVQILQEIAKNMKIKQQYSYHAIYDQIIERKNIVLGKDIIQIIQNIKNQNQTQIVLTNELTYYQEKIYQLKLKDIQSLKRNDFFHHFIHENEHKSTISEIICEKVNQLELISLKKLQKLVEQLQEMKSQSNNVRYPSSISIKKSSVYIGSSIDENNIIDELNLFIDQNIKDPFTQEKLQIFIKKLRKYEQQLQNQLKDKESVEENLRKQIEQQENYMIQSDNIIQQKDQVITRLQKKNQELLTQLEELSKTYKETLKTLNKIQYENDQLFKERNIISHKLHNCQEELSWFRSNYRQLTQQYTKVVQKIRQTQEKAQNQKDQKFFSQRTMKEQLEDAHAKIKRLREQKTQLSDQFAQSEVKYQAKINQLQLDLQQASQKRLRDSQMKIFRISDNFSVRGSFAQYAKSKEQTIVNQEQMSPQRTSTLIQKQAEDQFQNAFKKQKDHITLKVTQILTSDPDQRINLYDDIGILENTQNIEEVMKQIQPLSKQINFNFVSSTGYLVHDSGDRFPRGIILGRQKIAFLDTKNRYKEGIPFSKMEKIYICYHNLTWIVIKVKKNDKSQDLRDTVFSIPNREEFLDFLLKECAQSLKLNKIKVKVEKQENIWLQQQGKQALLSNFRNFYNIYRISMNNSQNVFQITLKDNSMFSMSSEGILIITTMGLLIFESDGEYNLERKQNFLFLLPLVEKMEIIEIKENQIKITYQTNKKTYKIKAQSQALMKRLKKRIERQKQANLHWKTQMLSKYQNM